MPPSVINSMPEELHSTDWLRSLNSPLLENKLCKFDTMEYYALCCSTLGSLALKLERLAVLRIANGIWNFQCWEVLRTQFKSEYYFPRGR